MRSRPRKLPTTRSPRRRARERSAPCGEPFGDRDVSLTTTWDATFSIDGGGPYPVPAPAITKTVGPIPVPVREARSALVGG